MTAPAVVSIQALRVDDVPAVVLWEVIVARQGFGVLDRALFLSRHAAKDCASAFAAFYAPEASVNG